jgi:uncharacterized protein YgbK (DUF1537 family)
MATNWLIIADDLTGAADCAVAFAKRRLSARVVWGDYHDTVLDPPLALSIDSGSRVLDASAAYAKHTELLRRYRTEDMRVFKKIDSTLRGHPAHEIAALLDVMRAQSPDTRLIVAPAFPATGRVTRDARVYVHGTPLELTEFWPPGADATDASVVRLLETVGITAAPVSLGELRSGEFEWPAGQTAVVCDAETESDLDIIAAVCLGPRPVLLAGSAGLAHAIARKISPEAGKRARPIHVPPTRHGALLVAGSQAQATRAALLELDSMPGIERLTLTASCLDRPQNTEEAIEARLDLLQAIADGRDLVVDFVFPDARNMTPTQAQQLAARLARRVIPFAAQASALVATGGETAATLFERLGITGIQLVDEIEHGIALGLTLGSLSVPVVTKAGGFGDAGCLRRIVERLRFIRGSGAVA